MYHVAVCFEVAPERRDEFVAAALENARSTLATDVGTRRFELVLDDENPNRFVINEAHDDATAFEAHASAPHVHRFLESVRDYAQGPTVLIKGPRAGD